MLIDGERDETVLDCDVEQRDGAMVIRVAGEIDLDTAPALVASLERIELDPTRVRRLVVDLREVSFMDSTGVRVLMNLDVRARRDGVPMAIVRAPGAVAYVLDLCEFSQRVPTTDDPAELA